MKGHFEILEWFQRQLHCFVKNTSKTRGAIVKKLSTHVELDDKDKAGFFVGGEFSSEKRKDEFLVCRSLLTLDIDKYTGTIVDLELTWICWV